MAIFQKSVINKYLKNLDNGKVSNAFEKFQEFYGDKLRLADIVNLKEENYQEGFLREIFVHSLGYTIRPDFNYNLTTEYKNQTESKKADGAIIRNSSALGVIELKSTKTFNLERIKNQAFNYKHNQPDCRYVITSNFHHLRFYIDNSTEYEEFDLFEFTLQNFRLFYLILSKDSIFNDIPLRMKEETKFHEEDISDKFYKDYKSFKDQIFENLVKNNSLYDKLTLFKKSQKLLDRFLFIYFGEDCGLCPPNTVQKIIDQWKILKSNDAYVPLYYRFQKLFNYLDVGKKFETFEFPGYNGGLFKPDELLDHENTIIDDSLLLDHGPKLSAYDFNTDIDVNILGRIFEHSLNEIEEITAELKGGRKEKSSTKRKKDGIFYTPKYITNYIVENTIGRLCKDKQAELQISEFATDGPYSKNGKITKQGKELFTKLQDYKNWLLALKILDPACGSGAFLNSALDFLINEHHQVDVLISDLTGDKIRLFDTDKTILENNIFGVDINDESVEIAKLSLWLRTAKKNRKLSDLNQNIKCGNSLIDSTEIAGNKAFDWNSEFPGIMQNGGFDVVLGNPPYVNINTMPEIHQYLKEFYSEIHTGYNDLMYYFLYKGIRLLNPVGIFGVITSNYFIGNEYAGKLRLFLNKHVETLVNFEKTLIFEDANVHTTLLFAKKETQNPMIEFYTYLEDNPLKMIDLNIGYSYCSLERYKQTDKWLIANDQNQIIIDKLHLNATFLGSICEIEKGSTSGKNSIFTIPYKFAEDKYFEFDLLRKNVKNGDIERYIFIERGNYLIYTDNQTDLAKYPNISAYLNHFYDELSSRNEAKKGIYSWFRLERPRDIKLFDSTEKLIVPYRATKNRFAYDNRQFFNDGGDIRIIVMKEDVPFSIKYLLALLNSSLLDWFYGFIGKAKGDSREYFNKPLSEIPIKNLSITEQKPYIEHVDKILQLLAEIQTKRNCFTKRLSENFDNIRITTVIESFMELSFKEFIIELAKQKIALSLMKQDEWSLYFESYKKDINELTLQKNRLDKEIERMVFALYGLTIEEVALVEKTIT